MVQWSKLYVELDVVPKTWSNAVSWGWVYIRHWIQKTLDWDLSRYGQNICPKLTLHCIAKYLKEETRRI